MKLSARKMILHNPISLKLLSIPRVHAFIISFRLMRIIRKPIKSTGYRYSFTSQKEVGEFDLYAAGRILRFLEIHTQKSSLASSLVENSPWAKIVESQIEFMQIIESKNVHDLAAFLLEGPKKAILSGVLQGDSEYQRLKSSSRYRRVQSQMVLQRLMRLSDAIGGQKVQNPEQGDWGSKDIEFAEQIYVELENYFGNSIEIPDSFSGLFRVAIGSKKWNQVELMSMNSAMQIKKTLNGDTTKNVLEIGAGIGYTTFWLKRLGFNSISIIDLPHVVAVQAFFLMKSFPESKIYLHGESNPDEKYEISIFPHTWPLHEILVKPDLIFNQDSFAEMSSTTIEKFLQMDSSLSKALLFSINHETEASYEVGNKQQVNITKIVKSNRRFIPVSRVPNWIREGYIDQIWKIS